MDLEKKLEKYYENSPIIDDMKTCEAKKDVSKIKKYQYGRFYLDSEFLKDYYSIEDDKLKERYQYFIKIILHGSYKSNIEGYRFVIFDLIINKNFQNSLRYISYNRNQDYKDLHRLASYEKHLYKLFEDLNKYFNKEFNDYINKYIDIILNKDSKNIFKVMDRDAIIPLIAICSVINNNNEDKYVNAVVKSFDVLPNIYDALNAVAAVIDKNELIKNKFLEVLNNHREYIINMNISLGNYIREKDYNNTDKIDKFYKKINYPSYFAFIAKYFEDYYKYDFFSISRSLYLENKKDFYIIYNLISENIEDNATKTIFIVFTSILAEHNDSNNIDLENFRKSVNVLKNIVKFFKENTRPDLTSTEKIEEIFDKNKNKNFNKLIKYYTDKKNVNNICHKRDTHPDISFDSKLLYIYCLFNYENDEIKDFKKLAIGVLKYLPVQLGIRKYIEVQSAMGKKTLKEIIDSLLEYEELNITLKEILLSYYYNYAGDLSGYYYDSEPPQAYRELKCIDENNNIVVKNVKDELFKSYFEDIKNILNDNNFIIDNISNNKNTALDLLKTMYNKFNYKDYNLVYTILESTKKAEVKRYCLKLISDNEDITREYAENMSEKARASDLKGALKNIIKNWNIKKYGDSFLNIDAALDFVNKYYNTNYEKNIKFLESIHLTNILYSNGQAADEKIFKYIIMEYMNLIEPSRLKDCDMLIEMLDGDSFTNALELLYTYWKDSNYEASKKNILIPYLLYSDDLKIDKVYPIIKEFAKSSRTVMAGFIVKCIALNGKSYALILVDNLTRKAPTAKIKEIANETMQNAAYMLNMTADELSDRIIPNFGFNKKGERVLSYGGNSGRTFTLSINNNLELTITDNGKQKIIKSLPSPNSNDDKTEADNAKKEYKILKKEIKTLMQSQKIRLQKVLMNGRKWTYNNFKTVFIENPIMNLFALKLIWGVYDECGNLIESFRYMEDGTFNTADEEEYTLKENSLITLVHPSELDEYTKNKWKNQLSDYEIVQIIEQLDFKYEAITETDIYKDKIYSLNSKKVKAGVLMSLASKYDMIRGETLDAGTFCNYILKDAYMNISVHITFDYMYFGMEANEEVEFWDIEFYEINDGIETLINPLKVSRRFASSIYGIVKSVISD
ncbi:DUF4132 domain-containing protein [uncultured Brachyspira sp.]|uniref:DUF4132 domain-containing protein n=1 Tax=uncultured Brachyspira sp. TaxID=221953 RepID=UPI0025FA01E7|nr:DUF4132 domain-containing protein [uncultured Brachyspira sp.]